MRIQRRDLYTSLFECKQGISLGALIGAEYSVTVCAPVASSCEICGNRLIIFPSFPSKRVMGRERVVLVRFVIRTYMNYFMCCVPFFYCLLYFLAVSVSL